MNASLRWRDPQIPSPQPQGARGGRRQPVLVPLWTRRYNGPGNDEDTATAIAVDSNGNVFVTGASAGTTVTADYATLAYSGSGVALWTNRYNGIGNNIDGSSAIAVDRQGNVFVTGGSYSGSIDTTSDFVTIKYSSSITLPRLDFQKVNNQLVLSWTNVGFNLQSAPIASGTFTNIPDATSPYTNSLTAPKQFFRLESP